MSMNLTCHSGDSKIELWQTPTFITYMCLSYNESGEPDGGNAGVLRRYIIWLNSQANGTFASKKDLDAVLSNLRGHVAFLKNVAAPHFSYE